MTLQQLRYALVIAQSGSMNEAAKKLFISQPSLSGAMKELEEEVGCTFFLRSNRGVSITPEGEEFLGYAKQIIDQYQLLEQRYFDKERKERFAVSTQHYSFAVNAFVEVVSQEGMDAAYDFAIFETRTHEVIMDVRNFKSELGILYLTEFNESVLKKLFREHNLEFHPLFSCDTYVYLWSGHPLAQEREISMDQLQAYPCLAFDQGQDNSFFLAEEMKSTYDYRRIIRANDRATMLNLMSGLNGYTLCSGVVDDMLNGGDYKAIPLVESERIHIGYIRRRGSTLSELGQRYVEALMRYANQE